MTAIQHMSFQQQMVYFYMFGNSDLYPAFPHNEEANTLGVWLKDAVAHGEVVDMRLDETGHLNIRFAQKLD